MNEVEIKYLQYLVFCISLGMTFLFLFFGSIVYLWINRGILKSDRSENLLKPDSLLACSSCGKWDTSEDHLNIVNAAIKPASFTCADCAKKRRG